MIAYVVVAVVAFGCGWFTRKWYEPVTAPVWLPIPAPEPVAPKRVPLVVVPPVDPEAGPPDAYPERFTLYVDGQPITSADDWRDLRDLWRAAEPDRRSLWDRQLMSWR